MGRYRKKPVEIEAVQFTGENSGDVYEFAKPHFRYAVGIAEVYAAPEDTWVKCPPGHWVIRGVAGEFYPCDPDVFEATYEKVES